MIKDGKASPETYADVSSPVFSADDERFAYIATQEGKMFVVEGQHLITKHQRVTNLSFSPNGKRLTYVAKEKGSRWFYFVDGHRGTAYDAQPSEIQFSPDNRHFAFFAKQGGEYFMSINGKNSMRLPTPLHLSRPVFDSSTKLHTIIRRGNKFVRVEIEIKD